MSDLKVITDHKWRDVLSGHDLTDAERAELDYLDWSLPTDDNENGGDGWPRDYIRYRGVTYDLGEFMRASDVISAEGWDGYMSDSYFSGVLVRYSKDGEQVIMATFLS